MSLKDECGVSARKKRLYRVVIESAPGGPVPVKKLTSRYFGTWEDLQPMDSFGGGDYYDEPPTITFRVGQTRTHHSRGVAERRADRWAAHGCTVRIDRSKPVEWEEA